MRYTALLFLLLLAASAAFGGVCKGEDPCKACKDCSRCKFCDPSRPGHGSCGTMRDQSGDEARRRDAKRAGKR